MLFNPYVLLAVGIVWLASVGSAYVYGHRNAANAAKAAYGLSLKASIDAARVQAIEDMQLEAQSEEKRQKVRIEYRDRVNTVEKIIRQKPSDCRVSDDLLGLLDSAIDSANTAIAAKPVPVPASPETGVKP